MYYCNYYQIYKTGQAPLYLATIHFVLHTYLTAEK